MESDHADRVPPPDDQPPADPPADSDPVSREPHLTLVDAVLASSRAYDAWTANGGPRPQLPRGWEALWRDAVRRQTDLAGEPEEEARRSVQAMLDQLTRLDRAAGWFRTDRRLRERAIAETLLHGTGLGPAVPSRPAQLAWQRQRGLRPVDYAKIQAIAAAQDDWLAAWNDWAAIN
ncbi:hypothetical protein AB0G04_37005 [Actinoplanes sp. NPDC023801]|uniref:hypothetical protein n=1 Tax=Actinoplanes sp. NPDC023801 TaxID=3154595 RepID=UPI0033FCD2A8